MQAELEEALVKEMQDEEMKHLELFGARHELNGASLADELSQTLPGNDGSSQEPRAQAEHYSIPRDLSPEERKQLQNHLVDLFLSYVRTNKTQEQVTDDLLREKRSEVVFDRIRRALPASFKQLLRALELFSYPVRGNVYKYAMCPCGALYRWVFLPLQVGNSCCLVRGALAPGTLFGE